MNNPALIFRISFLTLLSYMIWRCWWLCPCLLNAMNRGNSYHFNPEMNWVRVFPLRVSKQMIHHDHVTLRAFAFVLILSLKKASAKSKGFGVSGGLELNLLVKHIIWFTLDTIWLTELLYFEILNLRREMTIVDDKCLASQIHVTGNLLPAIILLR